MSTGKNKVVKMADFFPVRDIMERMALEIGAKTDKEFVERLGFGTEQMISQYRLGKRDISWQLMARFSEITGKSFDWILRGCADIIPASTHDPFTQEFTMVPLYKARLSGGH